jgi:hypothetical protein
MSTKNPSNARAEVEGPLTHTHTVFDSVSTLSPTSTTLLSEQEGLWAVQIVELVKKLPSTMQVFCGAGDYYFPIESMAILSARKATLECPGFGDLLSRLLVKVEAGEAAISRLQRLVLGLQEAETLRKNEEGRRSVAKIAEMSELASQILSHLIRAHG